MPSKAEELKAAGNAAFKAGNYDLALANYTTAIQLDPSVSTYALNRAAVHLKLANWRDAERDSTTALKLDGGANPKALYRRGLARKGLGKLSAAKEVRSDVDARKFNLTSHFVLLFSLD
ncbi:TPR-repeat containing protein [Rhodotorula toruloides]|uniref:TPR-repeat containing protein n=1 Tax=Rhodotorula toruloides TaxID=5286 RepID=A0A511KM14_RHOTO|nr:TPR-repeat containing protein [Rhodotorula toruloides]